MKNLFIHACMNTANDPIIKIFWDVMLCCWVSGSKHFKGMWCLHLQGQAVLEERLGLLDQIPQNHIPDDLNPTPHPHLRANDRSW
jgi:hypothetical protein